ncbi:AEC family transporter [Poriferisphaera sp. WC338]|uniref:AEC family transporter n=1 Tax=Poriferisphaera sp. WC338 TaxID=3425129 RepID=UPI003D812C22
MDGKNLEFIFFTVFNIASFFAGYVTRRKNWLNADVSRRIHFHTVAWIWSAAVLLSLWRFPFQAQDYWLLAIIPLMVAVPAFAVIPICQHLSMPRSRIGVMACACGMGNMGFTLGAYLCYVMLSPPANALAYGIAAVSMMQISSTIMLYPIARYFGRHLEDDQPLWIMMIKSFDLRAMPLYAAVIGLLLARFGPPAPLVLWDYNLMDIIFYLGAFGAIYGIGMRVHVSDWKRYLPEHILLAAMKFLFIPVLAWGMLQAINTTALKTDDLFNSVIIIESFMPTALMTVMMANMFHLDTRLASSAWLINTVLFLVIPLPFILWWLS